MENKYELIIPLKIDTNINEDKKREIASILDLPEDTQPDLLYFNGVLVSSGRNLNCAEFLTSELVKAEASIINKPIDLEHNDQDIIGHIYSRVYIDKEGNVLDLEKLKEDSDLDSKYVDIVIAGVIYKDRFPEIAKEIKDDKWSLSMETYYKDFDIKIGKLVFSRSEADVLGLVDIVGTDVCFVKDGKEIAKGKVTKVLKDLTFCGCGVVKNPANPGSVFLDVANKKEMTNENDELVCDVSKLFETANKNDNSSTNSMSTGKDNTLSKEGKESSQVVYPDNSHDGPGIGLNPSGSQCVYFQRLKDGKEVNWCSLYDTECTSVLRDVTSSDCLYYRDYYKVVSSILDDLISDNQKITVLIDKFKERLVKAFDRLGGKI